MNNNEISKDFLQKNIHRIYNELENNKNLTDPDNLESSNYTGIHKTECTVLFADFGGTTDLVDNYDHTFAAWVLKSYLTCASHIIKDHGGTISAFEGDAIMGVFYGDQKENIATKCAFQIQWSVIHIIQPKIDELFPSLNYDMGHVVGIDSSDMSIVKTDIWEHYDFLWVGRAANYSANFTRIKNIKFSTYITDSVYLKLFSDLQNNNKELIWDIMPNEVNNKKIYRTGKAISI